MNRLAQIGALASLNDACAISEVLKKVKAGRDRIHAFAETIGLHSLPSAMNFVAVDLESTSRASKILAELNNNGIFIRMPGVEPLNRFIRVGIGTADEHAIFEQQFTGLFQKLAKD